MKNPRSLLLASIAIVASSQPALAEKVTIQVVAKGSNPPVPIQSRVKITVGGGQLEERPTNPEGILVVDLVKCDESGHFEASPVSGIAFRKAERVGCQPVPILIELPRNRFAAVPQDFIRDDFSYLVHVDPDLQTRVLAANETDNPAVIGQTAADVAWALRQQGDIEGAKVFQSVAIGAGVDALATVVGETPSDEVLSRFTIRYGRDNLTATSPEGEQVLRQYQAHVGIAADGIWGPQTFRSLAESLAAMGGES